MKPAAVVVLSTVVLGTTATETLAATPAQAAAVGPAPASAAAADAEAFLLDVAKAYQAVPAMTDSIRITQTAGGQSQDFEWQLTLGSGTDAALSMPGMTLTALGDKLYVLRDDIADKYLALPLDGNLVRSSTAMFGGRPIPLPQLALRAGRSLQEYVDAFDTGLAADLEVRSVEPATINGKSMQQLRLASPGVSLNALVDPATRLLSALELVASDVKVDFAFETKVLPSAAGAVVFTPGSRAAVESLNELQPQPPRPGDAAPDFSLTALDGKVIDLKSLAGNVVVLDFWATWCPPCRRGLPLLQEFADWAKAEGKAVKVVAVNVWQREQGAEAQRAAVEAFWKEKGYSIPVVMDLKASLADAYLFSSIPQTVIIDPNGVIVAMHSGFRPDLVNMLKEHVAKAMAPAG